MHCARWRRCPKIRLPCAPVKLCAGERMDVSLQNNEVILIHCLSNASGDVRCLRSGMSARERQDGNGEEGTTAQTHYWESHELPHATDGSRNSATRGLGKCSNHS